MQARVESRGLQRRKNLLHVVMVARLDDELNLDPFSGGDDMMLPVTVGDFVRIYENAAG